MKIRVAAVHNLVVTAETHEDVEILNQIVRLTQDSSKRFWVHGYGRSQPQFACCGYDSFNFGFISKFYQNGNTDLEDMC